MWHRFSEELREAVLCAAQRSGGGEISTRDLLCGLVSRPDNEPAQILQRLGIAPPAVQAALGRVGGGETAGAGPAPGLTIEARAAVDQAYQLAADLGDSYIGGEHLLLAFVKDPQASDAGRALAKLGVTWQSAGRALLSRQLLRLVPPGGVAFPTLPARRAKVAALKTVWRAQRVVGVLPRLTQPFAPYILTRDRVKRDPYPFYARLRRRPLYYDTLIKHWVATGYEEVSAVLAEPRFSHRTYAEPAWQGEPLPPIIENEFCRLEGLVRRQMLFLDSPEQTRQRALVARRFTPAVIAHLRQEIERAANDLLDQIAPKGGMDIIADFAVPFPIAIIARMLGIPESDRDRFKEWSDDYITFIASERSLADDLAAYRSIVGLTGYFQALLPDRRAKPGKDLVSLLLAPGEAGETLTEEEVVANCFLLLAGGHENTTRLIGNGLSALFAHPLMFAWLREDFARLAPAIDEMLRYESPVQWTDRVAAEDFTFRGNAFKKGERVLIGLAAANRDPAQFPEADQLDLSRAQNRHLAFGNGPHYCLGAALTRLEGQVAFAALLSRFPKLRLDGDPVRPQSALTFRGLSSLPVRWD